MRQIHQSQLSLLSKCGIAFENRYVKGIKTPPGVAALVGTAVDRSVSSDLQSKIDTGELLRSEAISDLARDSFRSALDRDGVVLQPDDAAIGEKRALGAATDRAVRLAGLHHRVAAPGISAKHVQREFVLNLRGYDCELAGTIDVQETAGDIRDTKTRAKTPSENEADKSLQLLMYGLAIKVADGAMPKLGWLDILVDGKFAHYEPRVRNFEQRDFDALLSRVGTALRVMDSGNFTPAEPDHWICSAKWCGFYSTCPYAMRRVTFPLFTIQPATPATKEANGQ